jgi:hypothetical protein
MKTVTIKIGEDDYQRMVEHFASERPGRPVVAVWKMESIGERETIPAAEKLAQFADGNPYGAGPQFADGVMRDEIDGEQEPIEESICPEHGQQVVEHHSATRGADPYDVSHLSCGCKVICMGPGEENITI